MKISAGRFKGVSIQAPRGLLSRPPLAIIRESIFNIIGRRIEGKSVLDLFAGSGSLGIEALSRGASEVHFVDQSRRCVEMIQRNLNSLGIGSCCNVIRGDAIEFVGNWSGSAFDIIFIDPPFLSGQVARTLNVLEDSRAAGNESLIVGRLHWREEFPVSKRYDVVRRRKFGESVVIFLKVQDGGDT